jgi:lipoyl(octanoyl) transferase
MTGAGSSVTAQPSAALAPVELAVSKGLVPYPAALARMEARVAAIRAGEAAELCWLLEHPPLYTAGTSARPADLLGPTALPVYPTGRGGQHTYHGPGQRVAYLMLDLKRRGPDLRAYIWSLEEWAIQALVRFGLAGERRDGRIGVWLPGPDGREAKIAAIGVRVRRWVSFHGIAINVAPELAHFDGIVPCGIREFGVTSLAALGIPAGLAALDAALIESFPGVFGSALLRSDQMVAR